MTKAQSDFEEPVGIRRTPVAEVLAWSKFPGAGPVRKKNRLRSLRPWVLIGGGPSYWARLLGRADPRQAASS